METWRVRLLVIVRVRIRYRVWVQWEGLACLRKCQGVRRVSATVMLRFLFMLGVECRSGSGLGFG